MSTQNLDILNQKHQHPIVTCLNPIDFLNPSDAYPIKFIFCPNEMRKYEVEVQLIFGGSTLTLKLTGDGVVNYNDHYPELYEKYPICDIVKNPNRSVSLSRNHIVIPKFPVFSTVERIIFIQNVTENILGYRWIL